MCQLNDGIYEPCTSPFTYPALSYGRHTFRVRAVDDEGNVDPSPPSYTWTVVEGEESFTTWLPVIRQ
jgi:large repetitive protein